MLLRQFVRHFPRIFYLVIARRARGKGISCARSEGDGVFRAAKSLLAEGVGPTKRGPRRRPVRLKPTGCGSIVSKDWDGTATSPAPSPPSCAQPPDLGRDLALGDAQRADVHGADDRLFHPAADARGEELRHDRRRERGEGRDVPLELHLEPGVGVRSRRSV